MFKPAPLFIGLRYTGSRRRSQLVSFISAISIVGLSLGVGLLITVLSVMNGFEQELRDRILGIVPQAAIYHRDGIENWRDLRKAVMSRQSITGAAPFVQLQGMVTFRRQVAPITLYGIDPEMEAKVSVVEQHLPVGMLQLLKEGSSGLVLGKGIADKLGIEVGRGVSIIVPQAPSKGRAPVVQSLEVVAILNSGTELDNTLALVNLYRASNLSAFPGRVSGLRLRVDDLFEAPVKVSQIVRELPYGYYGSDWTRTHGNLFHAIQISKNMVGLLLFLIIAIAAFNVVSTLVMVVVDKQGDIAILRTLGANTREIITIFMVQGSLIGFVGTAFGVLAGVILSLWIQDLVAWLELSLNIQFLKSDVYPISYLPADIHVNDIAAVALTALGMSFLATLYPAWKASKVNAAQALRYE